MYDTERETDLRLTKWEKVLAAVGPLHDTYQELEIPEWVGLCGELGIDAWFWRKGQERNEFWKRVDEDTKKPKVQGQATFILRQTPINLPLLLSFNYSSAESNSPPPLSFPPTIVSLVVAAVVLDVSSRRYFSLSYTMDTGAKKLLDSVTIETLHAHNFSRSSTQATIVLTDLLSRYLALLSATCARYAQHAGRLRLTARDAINALDELGLGVEELSEYCASEAKDLTRYASHSSRRAEDLKEFKGQSSRVLYALLFFMVSFYQLPWLLE